MGIPLGLQSSMKTTAIEQVTLWVLIWELTGMNFGRATEHLDQGFSWYFQSNQGRHFLPLSLPISQSLIILPLDDIV
jgi:hypothetical protein